MAGFPIVVVESGGLPVTEVENGTPYEIADNGYGVPVTFVSSGGLPLTQGGGWWNTDSVLDADFSGERFRWNGVSYTSEAAFLTAIGGVSSSGISIGPYVDPTATNLVTNGDFSDGITGWSAVAGTGATIAAVSGELELTAAGSVSRFSKAITGSALGRAFRVSGDLRRGTTGNDLQLDASRNANLASGVQSTAVNSAGQQSRSMDVAGLGSALYVGGRNTSGAGSGTAYFDNFEVIELWPFIGWDDAGVTVRIAGTTPASTAADTVVWQSDAGDERDRVRLVYQNADKHMHLIGRIDSATTQFDHDLGEVPVSTAFVIAFSLAQNQFYASLDGARRMEDTSGIWPGSSVMRVGRSSTGEEFTGSIGRVTVIASATTDRTDLENMAGTTGLWAEGDSYMGLTYSATLADDIATASGENCVYTAVGGTTLAQIRDRIFARPELRSRGMILWDGQSNGYSSVAEYVAIYQEIIDWLGHSRYLIIPPTAVTGQDAGYTTDMGLIRDWLETSHAANTIDYRDTLYPLNDGSAQDLADIAADQLPTSIMYGGGDLVHLGQPAKEAMATAIATAISGW